LRGESEISERDQAGHTHCDYPQFRHSDGPAQRLIAKRRRPRSYDIGGKLPSERGIHGRSFPAISHPRSGSWLPCTAHNQQPSPTTLHEIARPTIVTLTTGPYHTSPFGDTATPSSFLTVGVRGPPTAVYSPPSLRLRTASICPVATVLSGDLSQGGVHRSAAHRRNRRAGHLASHPTRSVSDLLLCDVNSVCVAPAIIAAESKQRRACF